MTYLEFHLVFILPAIALVGGLVWRARAVGRRELLWLGAMVVIAVGYTTPWDNYLVARGVWDYSPDRVIGTIGWVPIEEYLFFVLQPILTGLWLFLCWNRWSTGLPPSARLPGGRTASLLVSLALLLVGVALLRFEPGLYLGLILVWGAPVLALQVAIGWPTLWHNRHLWLLAIGVPTVYLWICDRIAIGLEIWRISERYTVGVSPAGLPLEEAAFFLITNVMLVQGLMLFRLPAWSSTFERTRANRLPAATESG